MKKLFLLLTAMLAMQLSSFAQKEQWADSVISFSSEYGVSPGGYWSASQIIGAYNQWPNCGDWVTAWSPATADGQRESIVVHFATPAPPEKIEIYETWYAGAIDTVYVRQTGTTTWTQVYSATAVYTACQILTINVTGISFNIDAVRIAINSPAVLGWNELDAVRLTSPPPVISIAKKSVTEGNTDTTNMKLTVSLNYPSDSTITVKYNTSDNTATLADNDYVQLIDKKLTFSPGKISKKITVQVIGDTNFESKEKLNVVLSNPVNGTIGVGSANGTIKNDDVLRTENNLSAVMLIKLWPNPAKDVINITGLNANSITDLSNEDLVITIIDIFGRSIQSEKILSDGSSEIYFALNSNVAAGAYFIKIAGNEINYSQTIIVE
ncbi:MAG: T9SS type A sorting domain-containing protein [Chitinophagales bacterium]|nr:T9SS type A sorting domain-containing protein [Chitinophagales bacterium]